LILAGSTIRLISVSGFSPTAGQTYSWQLATYTGSADITGVTLDTTQFFVPSDTTIGLSAAGGMLVLNFVPVPEPGHLLLAAAAAAGAFGYARRRWAGRRGG
jgi:hypothetical protein